MQRWSQAVSYPELLTDVWSSCRSLTELKNPGLCFSKDTISTCWRKPVAPVQTFSSETQPAVALFFSYCVCYRDLRPFEALLCPLHGGVIGKPQTHCPLCTVESIRIIPPQWRHYNKPLQSEMFLHCHPELVKQPVKCIFLLLPSGFSGPSGFSTEDGESGDVRTLRCRKHTRSVLSETVSEFELNFLCNTSQTEMMLSVSSAEFNVWSVKHYK